MSERRRYMDQIIHLDANDPKAMDKLRELVLEGIKEYSELFQTILRDSGVDIPIALAAMKIDYEALLTAMPFAKEPTEEILKMGIGTACIILPEGER